MPVYLATLPVCTSILILGTVHKRRLQLGGGGQMRTSTRFGAKNFWIFKIYGVSARTRRGGGQYKVSRFRVCFRFHRNLATSTFLPHVLWKILLLPVSQKVKCFRVCFRFQLLQSAYASTII